jgi:hypothetical protein
LRSNSENTKGYFNNPKEQENILIKRNMKKLMKIIGIYLLPFIVLTSCGGSNDATKKAEPIKRDTVVVTKPDTIVKEDVQEKAEVVSAKLNYIENSILEDGTFKQESMLKNGQDIVLNGCSQYELKKLSFKGTGSNVTLRIGKLFKKEGLNLSEGITITNKDTKEIETIEILDGKKSIFKVTVSNSGCN